MPYSIELFLNGCFVKDMRTGKIVATRSRKAWLYALDDWKMALLATCFAKMTEDKNGTSNLDILIIKLFNLSFAWA